MSNYTYYTDGAATMLKKDGKYLREAGGWAFICLKDNEEISSQSGGCPLTTNNEMELYAIYASVKDFLNISEFGDNLEICSDSAYCINIFTQWARNWKKRGWRKADGKAIQNLEIIKVTCDLIAEVKKNCKISFKKVKGHSNNEFNSKTDKLAVDAKIIAKKSGETRFYNDLDDGLLGSKKN